MYVTERSCLLFGIDLLRNYKRTNATYGNYSPNQTSYMSLLFYLVLYLLFAHNTSNSNGTLRWQDVEDFLSQCGDHPPEELDKIFQNVSHICQLSVKYVSTSLA